MIGMASDAMAVLLVISVMPAMIRHTNRFMTHGSRKSNTSSLHPIHLDSPDFVAASASANPPPSSIITPHETLSWATRQDKMGVKPGLGLVSDGLNQQKTFGTSLGRMNRRHATRMDAVESRAVETFL